MRTISPFGDYFSDGDGPLCWHSVAQLRCDLSGDGVCTE